MGFRFEIPSDIPEISKLVETAFLDLEISQNNEHRILDALREANALSLSMIYEENGEILGHVALSPVKISSGDGSCFGLGPIAVKREERHRGIGSALVIRSLEMLRTSNASACFLVGNPDFYSHHGFVADSRYTLSGVPPEFFMVYTFRDDLSAGEVSFHPAFFVE